MRRLVRPGCETDGLTVSKHSCRLKQYKHQRSLYNFASIYQRSNMMLKMLSIYCFGNVIPQLCTLTNRTPVPNMARVPPEAND